MDFPESGLGEDRPVGGRDYPRTWPEFLRFFDDEQACVAYLERVRWPEGFTCPACGHAGGWKTQRGLWVCGGCRHQCSATAGTIFAGTRTPLLCWFGGIWQLVAAKQGMSALGFKRAMGLGSYETAWCQLHKLRRAMVRPGRHALTGVVEVDEGYVGGRETGVAGRHTEDKSVVAVAVEIRQGKLREIAGRVRLSRIETLDGPSLAAFVADAAEPGATIRTDGWNAYERITDLGYHHTPINISATGEPASVSMPHVHRVLALLKRWLLGTHQGSVQAHQLDYYLDEFTFRFNRRHSRHVGLLFYRLLQEAARTDPTPLAQITGGNGGRSGTNRDKHHI